METKKIIRRYTDLTSVISILKNQSITLLSPANWEDQNDTNYLFRYRDAKKLKTILALCFTQASETFHHWKIYAPTPSGVCIKFDRNKLIEKIKIHKDLKYNDVEYKKLNQIREQTPTTEMLPFIKRFGFQDEKEWRVIFTSKVDECSSFNVPIEMDCIKEITLSPWLHPDMRGDVKSTLNTIGECATLKIVRSTLIKNVSWINIVNH